MMDVLSILDRKAVKVVGKLSSKKRLFHDLGEAAAINYSLDSQTVTMALLDREHLGPTGVGQGIALPHARIPGLERVCGVFLKLETPLNYNSLDGQPVDLIFALFAPEEAGVAHLQALALVSRILRNRELCETLRANSDPATLLEILSSSVEAIAA